MEDRVWINDEEEGRSSTRSRGIVVEYEEWGGRGFNSVTEEGGPSRERVRPEGEPG